MELGKLVELVLSLGGLGALVSVLVNIGKTIGWIKNDTSMNWVTGGNIVVLVVAFVLNMTGKIGLLPVIDTQAGQIAQIILLVFGFVWQMLSSRISHFALKGTAFIGKSYTVEAVKAKSFHADIERR